MKRVIDMRGITEFIEEINFLVSNFKIIFIASVVFMVVIVYLIHCLRKKFYFNLRDDYLKIENNITEEDFEARELRMKKDKEIEEMWDKFYAEQGEYLECLGTKPESWTDEEYDYADELFDRLTAMERESDEWWEEFYNKYEDMSPYGTE